VYFSREWAQYPIIDREGKPVLDSLVKPTIPIPTEATEIHGITDDMVKDAPAWPELHDQFCDLVEGRTVVIYNSRYDTGLLKATAQKHDLVKPEDRFDTLLHGFNHCAMLHYAAFYNEWDDNRGNYRWQRLGNAARQCGVSADDAHRALADCRMTLGVLQFMADFNASA